MRIVRATLPDAYKVHKMHVEYCQDIGAPTMTEKEAYALWLRKLTDEKHIYLMLIHGKKSVGMVWGKELVDEPRKTILIEGRYLRRAYRKNKRFAFTLIEAYRDAIKGFESIQMILPHSRVKLAGKYRKIGQLVELKARGGKDGKCIR